MPFTSFSACLKKQKQQQQKKDGENAAILCFLISNSTHNGGLFQPRKVSIDYSVSHLTVCVTSGLLLQPTERGTLNRAFLSKTFRWSVSKRMMYLGIKLSASTPEWPNPTHSTALILTLPYVLTRSFLLHVSSGWFGSYWFDCALTNSSEETRKLKV